MDELETWLAPLGLAQLAAGLRANDIDLDILPTLNEADLKELGLSLGHRRKLMRAAAELPRVSSSIPQPAAATAPPPSPVAGSSAERRQLTVMFCDLVGSTALSRQLDPEDLRELIRGYQDAVSGVVARHGGYVANFVGDGIVAYFGWPRADEDEAAQAIRAALAAIETVRQLPCGSAEPLSARVGIASGTVVVGDLETSGRRQPGAVAGDTPNLAARLQALAQANQVVIDELTRQLVGAGFVLEELGPQALKGLAGPVRASRVLAERPTESRFAAREGRLTPFIGRELEMALLTERFERAATGEGQVVLLCGEAGMGKSRIVETLCERLSTTPHTRMRMQCSPFHTTSTLHPVVRHLEYAAGFLPEDGPDERLRKLGALLRQAGNDPADSLAALAALLSLPVGDRFTSVDLTAEQRQARVLNVLIGQLLGLAAQNPVLFILEDAHWIDPATSELITQTLARIAEAKVLMVITHRPDWQTDWARHPQVTALTLNRLSRGQGAEIARAAAGALPEEIVARILRRADGVPLFIEELTRSVVETGDAFGDSGVPETLQASLLARLDRLGPEIKEIAQIAAVIGREFGSELLGAVAGRSKDALTPALERLITSHIALPTGAAQAGAYLFRHALIQDAAYQSLLLSRRRQYHAEIARALEGRFPEVAEGEPERIAQHYTAAAAPEQAIPYWVKAGERALARSVYLEPLAHFEQALQLARTLPESPERSRHILNLLLRVGEARLRMLRLHEALQTFTEAAVLARTIGAPAELARAALGAEETELYMGIPVGDAAGLLEAALEALGEGDNALRCRVLGHLGRVLFKLGAFERASALMREATGLARRLGDRLPLFDALDCAHIATTGQSCAAREFPTRRATLDEMTALAEEIGDRPDLVLRSLVFAMVGYLEMGDLAAFEDRLARYRALLLRGQIADYTASSMGAMQAILHGDFAAAERLAEAALQTPGGVDDEVVTGVFGVQMFTIRREQGRLAEVAPLVRRFVAEKSRDAIWRPGLALIATDLGFTQAAEKTLREIAAEGFPVPVDAKRNITLCYLAEVCARLGDVERAERLYELLAPYRDIAVIVPVATVCCGANARYLGMLASVTGDWTAAEAHFEAALEMDERLQAWPWLAHTKHEFALMLRERGRPGDHDRADALLAEASASAERFGMAALQARILSLGGANSETRILGA